MHKCIPEMMRQQVENLLAKAAETSDPTKKRKLASRAFALAQSAEAAERQQEDEQKPQKPDGDSGLDENLRIVTEHNLFRFLNCLYVEIDKLQRETFRSLLLQEEQLFAVREERLEMLQRLLRDCDGQVERQRSLLVEQRAAGLDITLTEVVMNNMLDSQNLLRDAFKKELRRG